MSWFPIVHFISTPYSDLFLRYHTDLSGHGRVLPSGVKHRLFTALWCQCWVEYVYSFLWMKFLLRNRKEKKKPSTFHLNFYFAFCFYRSLSFSYSMVDYYPSLFLHLFPPAFHASASASSFYLPSPSDLSIVLPFFCPAWSTFIHIPFLRPIPVVSTFLSPSLSTLILHLTSSSFLSRSGSTFIHLSSLFPLASSSLPF